jgi:hypothetical protein
MIHTPKTHNTGKLETPWNPAAQFPKEQPPTTTPSTTSNIPNEVGLKNVQMARPGLEFSIQEREGRPICLGDY